MQIPTLTPAAKDDGSCIFLEQDGRCGIHPVAPFGCAFFDVHQTHKQADAISKSGLAAVLEDHVQRGVYSQVWQHLQHKGLIGRPPVESRRLQRAAITEEAKT